MNTKNEKDCSAMTAEELRHECFRLLDRIDNVEDLREILTYLLEMVSEEVRVQYKAMLESHSKKTV